MCLGRLASINPYGRRKVTIPTAIRGFYYDDRAPTARSYHYGILGWRKTVIIWGGQGLSRVAYQLGGLYNPNTDTWTALPVFL